MGIQEALNKAVEDNRKLEKELQQKENIIKELDKQNRELGAELSLITDKYEKKLFIKENIIKEVRKYCDKEIGNIIANFDYIDTKDLENIRKILDKVGSDKE